MVLLFLMSIFVGWVAGIVTEKLNNKSQKPLILALVCVYDLGILFYFKYADFFAESINRAFGLSLPLLHVALPLGISFYTFQLLSYNIDIYKGRIRAQRSFINFATYVSMFFQLIAGPIVRYSQIEKSLVSRQVSLESLSLGIKRFSVGLFKKVVFANAFGEIVRAFHGFTDRGVLDFWLYGISFTLQIYFDFSGYSDMAIGLGKIFGFEFPENFNYPFISKSITEFWRRWHISLGSWFRDYVYIPLGGNKRGLLRQVFNILVVWALTGLWHGASYNFIVWGGMYGILLIIEKLGFKNFLDKHRIFGLFYTAFFTVTGFMIFESESFGAATESLKSLFSFGRLPICSREGLYYLGSYRVLLVLGIIGSTPLMSILLKKIRVKTGGRVFDIVESFVPFLLLLIVTAYLVDGSFNPFLYFRF